MHRRRRSRVPPRPTFARPGRGHNIPEPGTRPCQHLPAIAPRAAAHEAPLRKGTELRPAPPACQCGGLACPTAIACCTWRPAGWCCGGAGDARRTVDVTRLPSKHRSLITASCPRRVLCATAEMTIRSTHAHYTGSTSHRRGAERWRGEGAAVPARLAAEPQAAWISFSSLTVSTANARMPSASFSVAMASSLRA